MADQALHGKAIPLRSISAGAFDCWAAWLQEDFEGTE